MSRPFFFFAAICFSLPFSLAGAAEPEPPETHALETRACAGVINESTKKRELMRELAAYVGQTLPDELRERASKHLEQVVKLKEECERLKRVAAAAK